MNLLSRLLGVVRKMPRFEVLPNWGQRYHESAETSRLNEAHWTKADDVPLNSWLSTQLATIRSRATYEAKNNPTVKGLIGTYGDYVVGQDGPTLQVQSDNDAYNDALEKVWRDWFAAPTPRPNVSGAALLKLWVRGLFRNGEFLARLATDSTASGPVAMRIVPVHPRRLLSPAMADPNVVMGIRFDEFARPTQYYLCDADISGQQYASSTNVTPFPPDLIIHEFLLEEEDQARGVPWLDPVLQPSADLRDYDSQVQDAARQIADQTGLFYTNHPDAKLWTAPETMDLERRTFKMAPPGWQPFVYPATSPPVQYPDYRAERLREIGRPFGMPLLLVRLDASSHNYSSARLDTQGFRMAISGIQSWLSGTPKTVGPLTRLLVEIEREARFSVRELRRRPQSVTFKWTWPAMPHVDPTKESTAEETALTTGTLSFADACAARGTDEETIIEQRRRTIERFETAGIPLPTWITGITNQQTPTNEDGTDEEAGQKTPAR